MRVVLQYLQLDLHAQLTGSLVPGSESFEKFEFANSFWSYGS